MTQVRVDTLTNHAVQSTGSLQPSSWDMALWSPTDWAGVAGFLLSVAIAIVAVARAIVHWWRNRLTLRRELVRVPGRYRPDNCSDLHAFVIHHDRGPSFRVEKVVLRLHYSPPTAQDERQWRDKFAGKSYAAGHPIEFPPSVKFQLSGVDNENTRRPLFARGESMQCEATLSEGWPWELIEPSTEFATVELYSMGRRLRAWDASPELRKSVPFFVEKRRGNGVTFRTVPKREVPFTEDEPQLRGK